MAFSRHLSTGKKTKTLTPTLEHGRPTSTPTESRSGDDSDDEVPVMRTDDDALGEGEVQAARDAGESRRLLGKGVEPLKEERGRDLPRQGWVTILGFSIPKTLLYLLALPPALLLLSLIFRLLPSRSTISLPLLSNGTHPYHPTTLLISLDGLRPSYLDSHPDLTSNLIALANSSHGLRAESMQPRFPTLTFPNHWSIMTGLYPESHGIVANDFWDPEHGRHFVYTKHEQSWDGDWWWGEPMWSVAQRGGLTAANLMWPGPPVTSNGIAPANFIPYRKLSPADKLHQVFDWLDSPIDERPQLLFTYIPNVDQMGHKGGPVSPQVDQALGLVNDFVGDLVEGLHQRNLSDIVNVLIVSDHGMTSTANERLIYIDDILGEEGYADIEHRDGWPSIGLRFKQGAPTDQYLETLLAAAAELDGAFAVYTHATMPERWHFNSTVRIAPIYVVPKLGWAITDHHEHYTVMRGDYSPKGNHGYDNIEPDMQAIFLAHGPFAKQLKSVANRRKRDSGDKREAGGWVSTEPYVMKSFSNLEIFSLVMRLMGLEGIEPPHNGTMGFWDGYLA